MNLAKASKPRMFLMRLLDWSLLSLVLLSHCASAGLISFATVNAPPGHRSEVFGINDSGVMVGVTYQPPPLGGSGYASGTGFIYDGAMFASLPVSIAGSTSIFPFGLNNVGDYVGQYVLGITHGFLHSVSATTSVDPTLTGASASQALGINDSGDIVGRYVTSVDGNNHGYLYSGGVFFPIDVPGAEVTQSFGINNRGDIVGDYRNPTGNFHGFTLINGVFTTIDLPGARRTSIFGVNDFGDIVGYAEPQTGTGYAFVISGGELTTFSANSALAPQTEAYDINNNGDIVGSYTSGDTVLGFIARVDLASHRIPEPSSLHLLCGGIAGLLLSASASARGERGRIA